MTTTSSGRSGPAGYTAAIYSASAEMQPIVIAGALDNCGSAGIAYGKAFAGDTVNKGFARGGAVERNVANNNILFGFKGAAGRRKDNELAAA